jgi:hypothetical protein
MPRILLSGVVDALAERAWGIIRRFDAGADWLPFVSRVRLKTVAIRHV